MMAASGPAGIIVEPKRTCTWQLARTRNHLAMAEDRIRLDLAKAS